MTVLFISGALSCSTEFRIIVLSVQTKVNTWINCYRQGTISFDINPLGLLLIRLPLIKESSKSGEMQCPSEKVECSTPFPNREGSRRVDTDAENKYCGRMLSPKLYYINILPFLPRPACTDNDRIVTCCLKTKETNLRACRWMTSTLKRPKQKSQVKQLWKTYAKWYVHDIISP